jgi:hypothetical protein
MPTPLRLLVLVASLLLPASVWAEEPAALTPSAETAAVPGPDSAPPQRLALGLGYPDLRLRVGLGRGWNVEAKAAFGDGLQLYSGRASWGFAALGPLRAMLGAEAGWAVIGGTEGLTGSGAYGQGFVGLEYPFAKRLRLSVDAGPAWSQATAEGQTVSSVDLVFGTALYVYLF